VDAVVAGEPELAIAMHCIRRPIIVYKEVTLSSPNFAADRWEKKMVVSQAPRAHCPGKHGKLFNLSLQSFMQDLSICNDPASR